MRRVFGAGGSFSHEYRAFVFGRPHLAEARRETQECKRQQHLGVIEMDVFEAVEMECPQRTISATCVAGGATVPANKSALPRAPFLACPTTLLPARLWRLRAEAVSDSASTRAEESVFSAMTVPGQQTAAEERQFKPVKLWFRDGKLLTRCPTSSLSRWLRPTASHAPIVPMTIASA